MDQERKRVALGLKQISNDPWEGDIPARYHRGDVKKGKVTKLTNFGVFVELEQGLEGLLHISELADQKVESPEDVVKVGDEIEVKILRVDPADRKIGLSRKRLHEPEPEEGAEGETPTADRRDGGQQTGSRPAATAQAAWRHRQRQRSADRDARSRRRTRTGDGVIGAGWAPDRNARSVFEGRAFFCKMLDSFGKGNDKSWRRGDRPTCQCCEAR